MTVTLKASWDMQLTISDTNCTTVNCSTTRAIGACATRELAPDSHLTMPFVITESQTLQMLAFLGRFLVLTFDFF